MDHVFLCTSLGEWFTVTIPGFKNTDLNALEMWCLVFWGTYGVCHKSFMFSRLYNDMIRIRTLNIMRMKLGLSHKGGT